MELPNGVRETYSYRDDGQLLSQRVLRGEEQVFGVTFEYDHHARIIGETYLDGNSTVYEYSENGYLIRETYRDPAGGQREISYQYDAVGNRLERDDSVTGLVRYQYDSNDQLVSKIEGADRYDYEYDRSGNLQSISRNGSPFISYEWSSAGRLLETHKVIEGVEQVEQYLYDPQGIRVGTIRNGETQYLLMDSNGGLSEVTDIYDSHGHVVESVSQGAGVRYSKTDADEIYSLQDIRGSISLRFDAAGNLVEHAKYDAFGRGLESNDNSGFLGEWTDGLSELVYLRARYYDSDDGRFVSVDPWMGVADLPITQHNYAYAGNDPINQDDPTGMSTLSEQLATLTIKNRLFQVGILQGLVGVISVALNSSIKWSGPVKQLGVGDYNLSKSNFESQPIGGQIGSVTVLAAYREVGASVSLLEALTKRAKAAKEKRLEENLLLSKALFGKKSKSYNSARSDLKNARSEGTYKSPEQLLGISIGDADIYTPAWMGHTGYSMTGAYLGGGLSAGVSLTGGNVDGIGAGAGGSVAIAAAVYGFGVGFSYKDTSKGVSLTETQNGAWLPDLHAGFSVSVGVSIPSYTEYRDAPK
nr:RHS repeat-associated core domain-containing protein [Aureliella helgolandensis]